MDKEYAQEWNAPSTGANGSAASKNNAAAKSSAVALKQIVTIRLDIDMLEWFKGAGPGYQTRINQILRQYMADHRGADNQQPN